jgi:RNA-splicing ligase RtcB
MPITINGKYNQALAFAKTIEANCEDKIRQYLDHEAFAGTKVRIMPDVHLGKGTVIGFTATCADPVVPSIVGFDIGCGVCACNMGRGKLRFDKLDVFIRKHIPYGMNTHLSVSERLDDALAFVKERAALGDVPLKQGIHRLSDKQNHNPQRVLAALGTLGGGNHFIEVDIDEDHNRWLIIHSGSRILGARTAEYHEIVALRETDAASPIKYLSGVSADDYRTDMVFVQQYARVNRALMALIIAEGFFKVDMRQGEYRESVHNYLDVTSGIIRKGAISAAQNEPVIIPFSMAEGVLLARGKGNPEWNSSAPHGAGRKVSRSQARSGLSLDEYRKQMRHVWSSTVCKETLDESPMAYKKPRDVLDYIGETVEIEQRLTPVYNFKAID